MPKKAKPHAPIGEEVRISINLMVKHFLSTDNKELEFPSSFFSNERAYVHDLARQLGLKSKSRGKGLSRFITIYKRQGSTIVRKDTSISLTRTSRQAVCNLISTYPVTHKERQDLLPVTERDRAYIPEASLRDAVKVLSRLTNTIPSVPPVGVNRDLLPFRQTLPIWPMKDQIMQEINTHSVVLISGETGSGKTTQVPQMIMDYCEKYSRNCRIICSQPRRISAITISERVALERDERLAHTVGYQVRLESSVSPRTLLTYCTNGILLRTLLGGDSLLSSVTHIIIDEVHERDKLSDFILIILRDAVAKYKGLKLILMSATLDTNLFTKYFNNCPVITVPGRLYEVQEYFLEDILKITGYITKEMAKVKKQFDQKNKQLSELEKWTSKLNIDGNSAAGCSNTEIKTTPTPILGQQQTELQPEKAELEKWVVESMDSSIHQCWFTGNDAAFAQLLHLIYSENVSTDYQHLGTGLTPLMVAAARGNYDVTEQLLNLGANVHIRSSNEMTALDWAKKQGHTEVAELIQAYEACYEFEPLKKADVEVEMSEESKQLLDVYHHCFDDELVDNDLILAILLHIHSSGKKGAVLIFLPGYDTIVALRDKILSNENKFLEHGKLMIITLHSKMQTMDQKQVFKIPPPGFRKIILSTNIAETSITIDDVIFVIDSGKVKQKSYNAVTNVYMLKTQWVSQACVRQRRGRAGRTQPGVCFHLFSSARYRAMEPHQTPALLCEPLQELCLHTKLLAPPNTPIAEFLARAIEPPSFLMTRNSVQLLKTMDALDAWEDLTELGHHLLEIPIEPRLGKTIIYSVILKCLDPILTIVCCISHGDPFILPSKPGMKRIAGLERKKFSSGSFSDHMAFLRVFQGWQAARHNKSEHAFCDKNFVSGASLELITGMRSQILGQLRACGLIKIRGSGDIRDVNTHSDNWAVVKAALIGGLYPNIARVDREDNVLRTQKEFKVVFHPSSTLRDNCKSVRSSMNATHTATIAGLPTDWVMFEELSRTGHMCHIKTCTVVSPVAVAIFAGPSRLPSDALVDTDPIIEAIDSDSDYDELPAGQTALFKLDDWITFSIDPEAGQLVLQLRLKWYTLLAKRLRMPNKPWSQADDAVIKTLVAVLSAEEQTLGLEQPQGVGQRPRSLDMKCYPNLNRRGTDDDVNQHNDETNNAFLATIENSGQRFSNHKWQPDNNACSTNNEQDGSASKQFVRGTSSNSSGANATAGSLSSTGSNIQYFVVKAGHLKSVEASVKRGVWSFTPNTERKILQSYKEGKTVILVFGLQSSGHFQGYARLAGDKADPVEALPDQNGLNPPLPVEWLKQGNIPFSATRHLVNPYNDHNKVQTSRDGQELEPSVGVALCKMWDNPPAGRNNMNAMNMIQQSQNYHGRPIRGRFHYGSHYQMHRK